MAIILHQPVIAACKALHPNTNENILRLLFCFFLLIFAKIHALAVQYELTDPYRNLRIEQQIQ